MVDPARLRRLAGRVSAEADAARGEALRVASAEAGWESTAAARYRARLAEGAGLVRAAAAELDELARAVAEHAAAVEHRQHQIAAAMSWVRRHLDPRWLEQKAAEGAAEFVARAHGVEQVAAGLTSGDAGWLDLAGRLGWSR